ncbi:methyltransferase domain-containing protein [Colletotrichum scovillei]|uniref:methyltransferase domain-containing protein n=1 Tax=Colletotrichum scovillei TaxID=1209932 RepID=UPI0015C3B9A8|nr:methyltransferase domain-containing protein [Colletotrichum scovillei]KAF4778374.1 methyltransferase domain-containing protein [Colletotrichum scovillei]
MTTTTAPHSAGPVAPIFRSMDKTIGAHWEETMIEMSRTMMVPLNARLMKQMGLGQHTTEPIAFLDSACGAGPATQELYKAVSREVLEKSDVLCADGSPMMVGLVERRIREEGWVGARARVLDAIDSGLAENSLTHVVIGLGLHLIPRWVADVRSAFASFPFDAPFEEKNRAQVHDVGRWYDEAWVSGYLQDNGFKDVETCLESGTVKVRDARHWLDVFGPVVALIVNTEWSEELRGEHGLEEVKGLIKEHLEGKYGGKGWDVGFACIVASGTVVK